MIDCPECHYQELEGTLFCGNCGAPLRAAAGISTTVTLPFSETLSDSTPPLIGKKTGPVRDVRAIRLIIPISGRQVVLPLQKQIRIGRKDPRRAAHPEVDLTQDIDATAGISRLHAAILPTTQGIAIIDLNSVNGTQVNNYRLPPHLPYALNNGDELKLGNLLIHVFLEG